MKESLLKILVSPLTKEPLSLKEAVFCGDEIISGRLVGPSKDEYPVIDGIPRFVQSEGYLSSFGIEWNHFKRTQLDSARGTKRSEETFIAKTGWKLDDLCGNIVLDAGCGMGRFLEIASRKAKLVIGVDLSLAVLSAYENMKERSNVQVVQADIFQLPFRVETFDKIYSIGVLHHTPSPELAFYALVPHLKKGGEISIWVYSKRIRNPVALFFSDLYRIFTKKMSYERLLSLAKFAILLDRFYRVPFLGSLLNTILPISRDEDPEIRWLDTFDWYSPKYQFRYSNNDVWKWFEKKGLIDVRFNSIPVSITGRKKMDSE